MLCVLKRTISFRFENPKQMFKLVDYTGLMYICLCYTKLYDPAININLLMDANKGIFSATLQWFVLDLLLRNTI